MLFGSNAVKASMFFTGSWIVGATLATGSLVAVEPLRMALSGPKVTIAAVSTDPTLSLSSPAMPSVVDNRAPANPAAGVVVNPTGPTTNQPSIVPTGGNQPTGPSSSNVNPPTNPTGGSPATTLPSGLPGSTSNPASVIPGSGSLPSIPSSVTNPSSGSIPSIPGGSIVPSSGSLPTGGIPSTIPGAGMPAIPASPSTSGLPAGTGIPALVPSQPSVPGTTFGIAPDKNGLPDITIAMPGNGIVPPTNIRVPVIPQNSIPAFNPSSLGH